MAFQGDSSPSSSTYPWRYDVFLSCSSKDTRHSFTAHLQKALDQKGIITFIDDMELICRERISPAFLSAIEESRISIIVFSETYASSRWLLDELLKIVECKRTKGQIVLPVFYKVGPSDVRKALAKHEERFKDDIKLQRWREALIQVASLSGWCVDGNRNEARVIEEIVHYVSSIIVKHTYFDVARHPVGIESRVQQINSLLSIDEMNDRRMVGILGAGGIGKTTIAKAIYNSIASLFEGSCFLADVRETSKQYSGLVQLQNTLLSNILGHAVKVDNAYQGINVIKRRLCYKRILLILDDVDDKLDQLDKLAGEVDWFGLGSRIIITTRDRKVLTDHGVVDHLIYEVKELDSEEALELFRWNAFREGKPSDEYLELMKDAISTYVGGLPLALIVLGSDLYSIKDIDRWKSVLNEHQHQKSHSSTWNTTKFTDEIIQNVSRTVNPTYFQVAKPLIGLESRVEKINSLLSIDQMNDRCERRMVGILGAGGIGKTTIVKVIYDSIADKFEDSCFLLNVRETCFVKLQNTILSKICGHIEKVKSAEEGITLIKERLCSKRVLLILDDVDHLDQLDKLAGEVNWFGLGSRIIITTRDRKVLSNHGVVDDLIYEVEELNSEEALKLFRWNAFREDKLTEDFLKLMEGGISYVGGLPLALEVLGSYLYSIKDIDRWKSALNKYKRIPLEDILGRLRISYDGLHASDKEIFLDIACYFIGKEEDDIKRLDSFGYYSVYGIGVLIERSLITINACGILEMHNLLRDMGREIVRLESPKDPGKRSRLWFHEDVRQVLEENTGTNKIRGILVDLPEGDMMHLSSRAFKNMKMLRLLMVNPNARFSQGPVCLPNELQVLDWPDCPLQSLPSNFHGENLVILRMHSSPLKQLEEDQNFQSMKIMDFSNCEFLKIISNFSRIPNLEELILNDCTNLVEIHPSVGFLDKLVKLNLNGCCKLNSFPRTFKLRSLRELDVRGCSSLNDFPEIECEMEHLKRIEFGGTGIKELPSSIWYLIGLECFNLEGCINLTNLSSSIYLLPHLQRLFLKGCTKLVEFLEKIGDNVQSMPSNVSMKKLEVSSHPELLSLPPPANSSVSNKGCSSIVFPALQVLDLKNNVQLESNFFGIFNSSSTLEQLDLSWSGIDSIPPCIKTFVSLKFLKLNYCKRLREILAFPPNASCVEAEGCMSLELYNKCWLPELPIAEPMGSGKGMDASSMQERREKNSFDILVSGYKIPDWFSYRKEVSNSNSCEIDVLKDLDGEITIIAFSAVLEAEKLDDSKIEVYVINGSEEIYCGSQEFKLGRSACVWLCFHVPDKAYNGRLRVIFVYKSLLDRKPITMKSCGVHLVRSYEWMAIDGIQVIKRPRDNDNDDDGNLESNWYPLPEEF